MEDIKKLEAMALIVAEHEEMKEIKIQNHSDGNIIILQLSISKKQSKIL